MKNNARRRRVRRVLELRENELNEEAAGLAAARSAENAAKSAAEAADRELEAVSERRRELAGGVLDARRWLEEDDWHRDRDSQRQLAVADAVRAEAVTNDARGRVLQAQTRLKQAEVLSERLAAADRAAEERSDRRSEDEVSARLAGARGPSRGGEGR